MKAYGRFSTMGQMAASVAVFAVLMLVLESGGLVDWAQRLELGPERSAAVPLVMALHRGVSWMGLERVRKDALVSLGRTGWSDDAVLSAKEVEPAKRAGAIPVVSTAVGSSPAVVVPAVRVAKPVLEPAVIKSSGAQPAGIPAARQRPHAGPPLVSVLPALTPVAAGKTRTVVLAGDSMMAVGLSPTLLRAAPQYKNLAMIRAFKSGTGLARPEIFSWAAEYPAMLGAVKPDIVLVAIGANDGQGFVENGVTYPFGTPEWQDIYHARVSAYLAMLQAHGATVVWLGLPPMKNDVYDDRIALLNRIDYQVVSESPGAVWFSTAGLVGDTSGKFQDFGSVHGSTARLRQADGIHLSDDGAVLISEKLLPWLAKAQ